MDIMLENKKSEKDNVMRQNIFIWFFLAMSFNAFANISDGKFFFLEREIHGVKMITEKSFSKWKTVSYFDREGFLLRKTNYYKNKTRADYRYEYSISDSLLEIKEKEHLNINNNPEGYIVYKYYYNPMKQRHRFEVYSSARGLDLDEPLVFGDNFVYEDGLLVSYTEATEQQYSNGISQKIVYAYNEKKQKSQKMNTSGAYTTFYSYLYNISGQLTDFIHEVVNSDNELVVLSGVVVYSKNNTNKSHIRYSNFDKRGNWKKSHFVTEKSKLFRSKRKIEYW